jgi:hypothetical protein
MIKCLTRRHKTLSSNPSTTKKKRKRSGEGEEEEEVMLIYRCPSQHHSGECKKAKRKISSQK